MSTNSPRDYLRRLPSEYYQGRAFVHWSMTIDQRRIGWLIPVFYYKFREILTHTTFRYGLACPIYCCMPDHIHLLWVGFAEDCDERKAAKYFRRQLKVPLEQIGYRLQHQPYDRVLRDEERQESAFEAVAEYIVRNPERAGLVPPEKHRTYQYTGCLVPGYPDLSPWQEGYWALFWSLYSRLCNAGLRVIELKA